MKASGGKTVRNVTDCFRILVALQRWENSPYLWIDRVTRLKTVRYVARCFFRVTFSPRLSRGKLRRVHERDERGADPDRGGLEAGDPPLRGLVRPGDLFFCFWIIVVGEGQRPPSRGIT